MRALCIVALAAMAVVALGVGMHPYRATAAVKPISVAKPPASAPGTGQNSRVRATLAALPLAFEANQGQTDPQVKYMARGNGYTVFLTGNDTVFALHSSSPTIASRVADKYAFGRTPRKKATTEKSAAIRMHLVGGNTHSKIAAGRELPGRTNYYIGNDSSQWQTGVKQYAAVSYRDVYPGVDMAFHGQQRQLEFDFIVAPNASAAPINLAFSGARKLVTDASGNLVLASSAGNVVLRKPIAYQEKNGQRELVNVDFQMNGNNVGLALGSYDHSRELIIDPSLSYATYLGGTAEDDAYGIAIDGSGNAYVTGQTESTNFPTAGGVAPNTNSGSFDAFVTKISADGSSLVYSTYVGGTGADSGNAIAVDASGDAFVAGGTGSTDFPHTGGFQTTLGGALDAFVFELNPGGTALTYSTYLGGSGDDYASGIALDSSGNAYIVGTTLSTDFPVDNPIQATINGASNGFVTKINTSGNAKVYSTYLGGGTGDFAAAVAVDSSGNAYVTGATQNSTFPTTTGAFQTTCGTAANCNGGLDDAFVTVINAAGSGFVYSTFLGGSGVDEGLSIAVDSADDAYVTGLTRSSTTFPLKSALQATFGSGATQNAFVTEINPSGNALVYSTFLGGNVSDAGAGIALDGNKNAYVTGQTSSSNFPTVSATQATLGGGSDAFVSEIAASGTQLVFSTYLGGALDENTNLGSIVSVAGSIAVDSAGANIYVAGNTASTNFPTQVPEQAANGGGTDAFVAKYATGAAGPSFTVTDGALSPTSGSAGASFTATITVGSVNGFNSAVALTCTGAPVVSKGPTCAFSNPGASVTPPANGTVTSTLTVSTTAAAAMLGGPSNRPSSGVMYALFLPVFGIALLGVGIGSGGSRRRKLFSFLMLGLVLAGLLAMPACSSGSSNGGGATSGTPAGTYTFTVTGTSGGVAVTGSPALTLTIN